MSEVPTARPGLRRPRRPRRRRWWPRGVSVALVLLAAVSGAVTYGVYRFAAGSALAEYEALVARGVRVSGTVVRAAPHARIVPVIGSEGTVVYRFSARDLVFEGSGESTRPNPAPAALAPGEAVQVVYDGTDPTRSCLCDPGDRVRRTRTAMLLAAGVTAVVVPLVGGLAAVAAGRRRPG